MNNKRDFARFKKAVNLTQYAASAGYLIDRKKSTRSSIAMRHANGDKVIISRRGEIWVYFSAHDESDNGTIIDFIAKRNRKSLGEIGRELDDWLGEGHSHIDPASYAREVTEQAFDRERVARIFQYARPITAHPYLENERKISRSVLGDRRFAGKLFTDKYGNVVFPHFDDEGLCGLELKNREKSVLTRGSGKGLWTSCLRESDSCLAVTESGIDAFSYHDLFQPAETAYASVSGSMNEKQFALLIKLVSRFPKLDTIILAVDHDAGGDKIATKIELAITESKIFSGSIIRHVPIKVGQDWNGHLQSIR